jgi:hypothetical protein
VFPLHVVRKTQLARSQSVGLCLAYPIRAKRHRIVYGDPFHAKPGTWVWNCLLQIHDLVIVGTCSSGLSSMRSPRGCLDLFTFIRCCCRVYSSNQRCHFRTLAIDCHVTLRTFDRVSASGSCLLLTCGQNGLIESSVSSVLPWSMRISNRAITS